MERSSLELGVVCQDQIRNLQSHTIEDGHDVRGHLCRRDRAINHSKALDTIHASGGINNATKFLSHHRTCAHSVPVCAKVLLDIFRPLLQGSVVGQVVSWNSLTSKIGLH